ncbi:MAG: TonB-dependent receptor [Methylophilales bacterium]|nr:TonB-dependent receptor [Methylophilales bacterium]
MSSPSTFQRTLLSIAVLGACGISQNVIAADDEQHILNAAPVVVTATRFETNSFDLPVAIDVVEKKDIQEGQLQMTLSESLIRVPGITAQSRTNQSQDPQISSRGFGSRSSFGVRGVRVYVDGIPLTMPDGQGQPGIVDLSAVKSIEVMRGPFSAIYGNSSGGVIQLLTADAPKTTEAGATIMFGSDNTKRQVMNTTGTAENIEYLLNVSNFETDGYRDNSSGKKEQATAKIKVNISQDTKLTALVNWFDQKGQDPLGLPRLAVTGSAAATPSAFINPKGVPNAAINSNSRVERSHTQIGFNLEHLFDENNSIHIVPYIGTRKNLQILPSPTSASGAFSRSSAIDRDFYGIDAHWNNAGEFFSKSYTLTLGATYGKSTDARSDINIQAGTPNRIEDNIVSNFDQYIQGKWSILDNVDIHAGARRTKVKLEVKDKLIAGANPDNSGSVEYQKTTPVIGGIWKVNPNFNLYANYGKGFETPTFIEAAYDSTADNAAPNLRLKPSESNNYELGAKAFISENTQANLTIYKITTKDELVVNDNASGKIVYTNANKTKRSGIEFSLNSQLSNNISLYAAYTLLDAKFDSTFTPSFGSPIPSGNRIPGTYKTQLYGEVAWKDDATGFNVALEGRHNSKVYVNDANNDTAPSYTIFNIRTGFKQNVKNWQFSEYVRIENMFDKDYIGSVRINDNTNYRYFEPATGRVYLVGLSANYKF